MGRKGRGKKGARPHDEPTQAAEPPRLAAEDGEPEALRPGTSADAAAADTPCAVNEGQSPPSRHSEHEEVGATPVLVARTETAASDSRHESLEGLDAQALRDFAEEETQRRALLFEEATADIQCDAERLAAALAESAADAACAAALSDQLTSLSEVEERMRADFTAAYEAASAELGEQVKAILMVALQMDGARAAQIRAEQMRALMEEEAAARKAIVTEATEALGSAVAEAGKDALMVEMKRRMMADVTTPEKLQEVEAKAREGIESEETAAYTVITKGWEATRRAAAMLEFAKEQIARWMGDLPDPTTLEECESFETRQRDEIEYNADVAFNKLLALQEPPDEEARITLFSDVRDFLADVAAEAIKLFVDALQDPRAAYEKAVLTVQNHQDHALRLGRNLLVDLTENGVPFPLLPAATFVKEQARGVPDKLGLSPEQASVAREAASFAWTEGCARAHDYYADAKNPCMPAKCVVM